MYRLHAIRLALLCCAIVAVLAACGSSSGVQENYNALGNEICLKFTDATSSNPSPSVRLQAIETALAGLQGLRPPHNAVEKVYVHLLYHFKAAVDLLKPSIGLAKHVEAHPDDKPAARRYALIRRRIKLHLGLAAADAFTLGMSRCQAAFGG